MTNNILIVANRFDIAEMFFKDLINQMPYSETGNIKYNGATKVAQLQNGDKYYIRNDRPEHLYGMRFKRIYASNNVNPELRNYFPHFIDFSGQELCAEDAVIYF